MLKCFLKYGGASGGYESERRKGKEPTKEKATTKEKSKTRDKGKRKTTDEGIDNVHGIIFRNDNHKARYNCLASKKLIFYRYIDNYTMELLGLKDDIGWMLGNLR